MTTLESDIDRLKEYNASRIVAARMRDDGLKALAKSVDAPDHHVWKSLDGVLEHAEVLKALLHQKVRTKPDFQRYHDLAKRLETNISVGEVMSESPDPLPVLRAAKAMCALAAAPDSAFSEAVMYYLYCIVREIQVADHPDWSVGSARGGTTMPPSGYVTWQCVRAIVDFQIALRQTALLIEEIATLLKVNKRYEKEYLHEDPDPPSEGDADQHTWEDRDSERLTLSFLTTITSLRDNIALWLKPLSHLEARPPDVLGFIRAIREELRTRISKYEMAFGHAVERIEDYRRHEFGGGPTDIRRLRTESAHLLGLATVMEAREFAQAALGCLESGYPPVKELTSLAREFNKAADKFSTLLAPIKAHVSHSLDRELAAVMTQGSSFAWDPAEMAFAAAAYGEVAQSWYDERIVRAVGHLLQIIGERGEVPAGRPIRTSERGYRLYAANGEILRALARVLEHVDGPELDPLVVQRMLAFFQDLQSRERRGVFSEGRGQGPQSRRMTASAVLALAAINRMLDVRINRTVYRHFSTRGSDELKVSLRDLFYGDYGLRESHPIRPHQRTPYTGVVMEWMRAHVAGVAARVREGTAPFSLVLHGPPGTGKTMLVEALAQSCKVTLVEVTPSDVVIGGAEQIERRTRDVMFALSLLTRTIILFDEFDPVLLRRNPEDKNPSVFSFLTPGMLPKLKNLYERARERSTAYVLITNLVGKLDNAAIRGGRFDLHLGIYPPDLLSRYGRLRGEMKKYTPEGPLPPDHEHRFWEVIKASSGGSMNTLGKPGWFTAPRDGLEEGTAFGYIYGKTNEGSPKPSCEAKPDHLTFVPSYLDTWNGEGEAPAEGVAEQDAEAEYKEWIWINRWDGALNIDHRPVALPEPPNSAEDLEVVETAFFDAVKKLRETFARRSRSSGVP